MERINLLVGASASINEAIVQYHLTALSGINPDSVTYVEGNSAMRKIATNIWASAVGKPVSSASLVSPRKALEGITHFVLLWDGDDLSNLLFEARLQKKKTRLIPVQVTKVVNKQTTDKYDVYIGRGTPWGNPFAIGHGDGPDRKEVIEKYKEFFREKIESDEGFRRGILGMKGLRLACFCKPAPCHGDVIAEYLNSQPINENNQQE